MANIISKLTDMLEDYKRQLVIKKLYEKEQAQQTSASTKSYSTLWDNNNSTVNNKSLFNFDNNESAGKTDLEMFLGKELSDEDFMQDIRKELKESFIKNKVNFEMDGKKYVNGELFTENIDEITYKNGEISD